MRTISVVANVTPRVRAVVSEAATVAPQTMQCFASAAAPAGLTAMRQVAEVAAWLQMMIVETTADVDAGTV